MGSSREGRMAGKPVQTAEVFFETTASAEDIDIGILPPPRRSVRILGAKVFFHRLDTYDSGVDIDLEIDDGSNETEIANYDTDGNTDEEEWYDFTFSEDPTIDAGDDEWLQVRIDDDEDAACAGVIVVEYVYEDISVGFHEA